MSNMLIDELVLIQAEYKELLTNFLNSWDDRSLITILDEIQVFWTKHQRLITCALTFHSPPYRSFVFTGATIFDIDENEHYPFLCLGDFHIWDDPICAYMQTALHSPNDAFNAKLKSQVMETIADNIKLIDSLTGKVFILPVRMLNATDPEFIHRIATDAFLSIFKEKMSFKDYQNSFSTIDEIIQAIDESIHKTLIFSPKDDTTADLRTRFINYRATADLPLPADTSDAFIFWFCIYSNIAQVVDILSSCLQYKLVPYIRYKVCFQYMLLITDSFHDNPEVAQMLFPCIISHVLYHSFDTKKYSRISIDDMCFALHSKKFEQQLYKALSEADITLDKPNVAKTVQIIEQELSHCL